MKYLLFSGSLRTESLNKKLISITHKILADKTQNEVTVADIRDLSIPVYDGDIEDTLGIPKGVVQLGDMIHAANALVISSPEYNGSISGPLKNTIDWLSRLRPTPFEGKPIFLMGASPGSFGSIRALGVTRSPLENLGAFVFPQTFAVPKAHEVLKDGTLTDPTIMKRLSDTLVKFENFAQRFGS